MDFDSIMKLIQLGTDHKYLAIAIVLIGWLTSLTSDWSKFPITIPGRYQPLAAATLGILYGVLLKIQGGTVWYKAVLVGFAVGLTTGGLYDVVINAIFGGKVPAWLAWLSFAKKGPPPPMSGIGKLEAVKPLIVVEQEELPFDAPEKPKPKARMILVRPLALIPIMFVVGCSFFTPARDIEIGKGACIIANAFLDSDALNAFCNLLTPAEKQAGKELSAVQRAKLAEQMKGLRSESCGPDAGLEGGSR